MIANQINIILADSHLLTREGLKSVLNRKDHFQLVGEAGNANVLLHQVALRKPDIVIYDYSQSPNFQMETLATLQEDHQETYVLIITSDLERNRVIDALGYGVKGFLTKECDEEEIESAIRAVAKGDKFMCSKVLDIILERDLPAPLVEGSDNDFSCDPVQLTERELEIVALMVQGKNAQQIADELFLSVHTVYTHRKNIMRKLDLKSSAEVMLYAINARLVPSSTDN